MAYKDKGWVYIIRCGDFPYFKMGVSTVSGQSRLDAMQIGSPFNLTLVAQAYIHNCKEVEELLHTMFADRWHKGEWYALDALSLHQAIGELERLTHLATEIKAGSIETLIDELQTQRPMR